MPRAVMAPAMTSLHDINSQPLIPTTTFSPAVTSSPLLLIAKCASSVVDVRFLQNISQIVYILQRRYSPLFHVTVTTLHGSAANRPTRTKNIT